MKNFWAALVAAMLAVAPVAVAASAHADVCGAVGGRHVDVGGCTDPGRWVAPAYAMWAAPPDAPPPCYSPDGVPYWTPAGEPC